MKLTSFIASIFFSIVAVADSSPFKFEGRWETDRGVNGQTNLKQRTSTANLEWNYFRIEVNREGTKLSIYPNNGVSISGIGIGEKQPNGSFPLYSGKNNIGKLDENCLSASWEITQQTIYRRSIFSACFISKNTISASSTQIVLDTLSPGSKSSEVISNKSGLFHFVKE